MKKKFIFLGVALVLLLGFVSASDYCINPVVTDISPSSINVDSEFTVGVLLDNCGGLAPDTIEFEILDFNQDIYIKEPLIRTIDDVGYASDRFLLYHMRTSEEILPGEYYFRYRVKYSGEDDIVFSKEGSFSVNVIGDKAELSLASVKTDPVLPRKGEVTEITLRIENFGDGTANSIRVNLEHSFEGSKESFLGTLDPDEDGPAIFTFIVPQKGEYTIPVKISYQDDYGEKEIETEINLYVLNGDSNIFLILSVIGIVLVSGGIIFYLVKMKKSKEKVIHQLLRGNELKEPRSKKVESSVKKKISKRK